MVRSGTLLILGLIGLFSAGCSLAPIRDPQASNTLSNSPEDWHARGRFSYAADEDRRTGQFDWQQEGGNYNVRLFGPFGLGSVKIVGSGTSALIDFGDQSYQSDDPNLLFFELTGMHLPIQELSRWMTGQASRRTAIESWQILYDEFEAVGEYRLPTRIDLSNDLVLMRVAISDWELDVSN